MKKYRCWICVEANNINEALNKAEKTIKKGGFIKDISKKEQEILLVGDIKEILEEIRKGYKGANYHNVCDFMIDEIEEKLQNITK